jgi:hypothetical protein
VDDSAPAKGITTGTVNAGVADWILDVESCGAGVSEIPHCQPLSTWGFLAFIQKISLKSFG